jgi:hypothetical protein
LLAAWRGGGASLVLELALPAELLQSQAHLGISACFSKPVAYLAYPILQRVKLAGFEAHGAPHLAQPAVIVGGFQPRVVHLRLESVQAAPHRHVGLIERAARHVRPHVLAADRVDAARQALRVLEPALQVLDLPEARGER